MQTDPKESPNIERLSGGACRRRFRRTGVAALALVWAVVLGCTTMAPAPKFESFAAYQVGAPDVLAVSILPDPVLERTVTVRPDGMITIDLVGDVPAAGHTVEEIAADLQERISRFKRGARATVSVLEANSRGVTVLGEVRTPSSFPLIKETRVVDAIGQVSGVTTFASKRRIRVVRSRGGEAMVYRVDLGAIERGDLRTNLVLAKGDLVYVPPTMLARFGYAVQAVLFPFQPLLGLGNSVAGAVIGR